MTAKRPALLKHGKNKAVRSASPGLVEVTAHHVIGLCEWIELGNIAAEERASARGHGDPDAADFDEFSALRTTSSGERWNRMWNNPAHPDCTCPMCALKRDRANGASKRSEP